MNYKVPEIKHQHIKPVYPFVWGQVTEGQKAVIESLCRDKKMNVPNYQQMDKQQAAIFIGRLKYGNKECVFNRNYRDRRRKI